MTAAAPELISIPVVNVEAPVMRKCARCSAPYQWTKSSSSLKMTFCSTLCEIGELGFSIDALDEMLSSNAL